MRLPTGGQVRGAMVYGVLLALSWGLLLAYPVLWFLLLVLVVVWAVVQERAYRASKIDNPSPTEPSEGVETEKPLFRVWEEPSGHCRVEWPEGADITDREDEDA